MPDPIPGEIFHDPQFTFRDGPSGNKLFVLLAIADHSIFLVARTTSNPASKSRGYGCHNNDRFPNFFIPREAGLFREDTWINLDYLTEFTAAAFRQRLADGPLHKLSLRLPKGLLRDLLQCAIESDGTTPAQEAMLHATLKYRMPPANPS
ncbi:MAG: hypothetical protein ACYC7I_11680 [Gammaproteobacteria bacterium]